MGVGKFSNALYIFSELIYNITMEDFLNYFRESYRNIKMRHGKVRLQYIWDYYKLWVFGIAFVVLFTAYVIWHRATVPSENWFYITYANTNADVGNGSQIWKDFVDYSGYDTHEKNVYFNNNCYFDPFSDRNNEYFTYFVAYVEAGTLDLVTMEKDDLQKLGEKGYLLDLSREEAGDLAEKYGDRLIYATPIDKDYSTEPVPIGIDISDSALMEKYHVYGDSCAVGISSYAEHFDAIEKFLAFIGE